ncbi:MULTISPECIES: acyltransferase family protein [unclassified Duganella]|uniref:acyltransferase family protein n=1 Tax=unclassified Duganella TaxID=2636909 RepID=UPI0008800ED7|nr:MULTISPECIES: acyltransferase family protein [unclassified Duganella]SDF93052.1 Peptidoglycan/LPS O-acetylase OafA/YrhL, contains acyltransferase and SGNH-hydrolase domains [Duganella sp. OV458]SDJ11855.1 Peptidoglycan/LPS O-acetylase OafA/YrhL, contains acyltransferase and SGNH-hydrolase domains [Duganella sp. OV510]
MSGVSLHPAYRADIDGLRAIAVLSVVVFHAFPTLLPGGFIGVDIFFVISGYLIGSILLKGMATQQFSFADFYARRVRRIFPALALVLTSCAVLGWFGLFPDEYQQLGKHMFAGASFVSNFFLWGEVGYFDTAADTKPLLHLWSLAVEEQFYIVWPPLLLLAFRRRWAPWKLVLLLMTVSFLINLGGVRHYATATFYSPLSRMWELLLGALLAHLSVYRIGLLAGVRHADGDHLIDLAAPRARQWLAAGGLLLIVLGLLLAAPGKRFPGWWALLPVLGATLLIGAGPATWINRKLLANQLLVWFGLISYPLYLWHWPILSYLHILEGDVLGRKVRVAALGVAVLLAWLTYQLLERPLRKPVNGGRKVAILVLAVAALGGFGGWVYWQDGLPMRRSVVDNAAQTKALVLVEDVANAAACKRRYQFNTLAEYCLLDQPDKPPTVALVGDSHAYHIAAGLGRHYRAEGDNLWYLGTREPVYGLPAGDDPYQQATPRMLDAALLTASVHTVIFSTAAKFGNETPDGRARVALLRATLRRFVESGRTVIWVNDLPALDFDPRSCITRAGLPTSKTRIDCSIPRAEFEQKTAAHRAAVAQVLKDVPQVQLLDSAAPLCDASRCHAIINGKLMYRDTHHLSYDGDLYVGDYFNRQLRAHR